MSKYDVRDFCQANAIRWPSDDHAGFTAVPQSFPGTNQYTLTISDSGAPVNTVAGVNDLLAVVTVSPGADLSGPIVISVGADTLLRYNTEGRPPDNFPEPVTVQQGPGVIGVPAPAAWVTLAAGGLILAGRGRLRRAA